MTLPAISFTPFSNPLVNYYLDKKQLNLTSWHTILPTDRPRFIELIAKRVIYRLINCQPDEKLGWSADLQEYLPPRHRVGHVTVHLTALLSDSYSRRSYLSFFLSLSCSVKFLSFRLYRVSASFYLVLNARVRVRFFSSPQLLPSNHPH